MGLQAKPQPSPEVQTLLEEYEGTDSGEEEGFAGPGSRCFREEEDGHQYTDSVEEERLDGELNCQIDEQTAGPVATGIEAGQILEVDGKDQDSHGEDRDGGVTGPNAAMRWVQRCGSNARSSFYEVQPAAGSKIWGALASDGNAANPEELKEKEAKEQEHTEKNTTHKEHKDQAQQEGD